MPIHPPIAYVVSSGQTSSGLTEDIGHYEVVLSGGTAIQNTVDSGGHVYVSSGGVTRSDGVASGGTEIVSGGGAAYAATIGSGGVLDGGGLVYGGADYGLLSGVTVANIGFVRTYHTDIDNGGSASAVTVGSRATLDININGIANSTTVLAGGFFDLVSSAREAYATVSGIGATMVVNSGCSAYADQIIGGTMVIEEGSDSLSTPSAEYTFISAGGVLSNLDVVEGAQIAAGGTLDNCVSSDGYASVASDTQVEAGGVLSDGPGGFGFNGYFGPTDEATVVSSGGKLYVGGLSDGADIQYGGALSITLTDEGDDGSGHELYAPGGVEFALIESGGSVAVADTLSAVIYDGAYDPGVVEASTFASGSVLSFAAVDFQSSYTDAGIISASDHLVGSNTFSGATLEIGEATVEAGATLTLASAPLGSVTISSGGKLYMTGLYPSVGGATVSAGGLILGTALPYGAPFDAPGSGGDLEGGIEVYGVVRSAMMGADGTAALTVQSGGLADTVTMADESASVMAVLSGGSAVSTYVGVWDTLTVARGGVVSGTGVYSEDARAYIYGSAVDTTVSDLGDVFGGGTLIVLGTATTVQDGYGGTVEDYGTISGIHVSNGGLFDIEGPGTAVAAAADSGATVRDEGAIVYSSGRSVLAGTLEGGGRLIEDGPGVLVMKAATTGFGGEIVLSAGTVELALQGEASGSTIAFAEHGAATTLQIDAADRPPSGATFASTLGNFDNVDDRIDLIALPFTSGAKATVSSGVLTLTDGAYTAKFELSGTEASKYVVVSAGNGGTLIRASAGAVTQGLRDAMAGFNAEAGGAITMSAHDFQSARVEMAVSERAGHPLLV